MPVPVPSRRRNRLRPSSATSPPPRRATRSARHRGEAAGPDAGSFRPGRAAEAGKWWDVQASVRFFQVGSRILRCTVWHQHHGVWVVHIVPPTGYTQLLRDQSFRVPERKTPAHYHGSGRFLAYERGGFHFDSQRCPGADLLPFTSIPPPEPSWSDPVWEG